MVKKKPNIKENITVIKIFKNEFTISKLLKKNNNFIKIPKIC